LFLDAVFGMVDKKDVGFMKLSEGGLKTKIIPKDIMEI